MTVLKEYQRLEAEAVWRASPEAQRRDVIVSIGKATITIGAPNGTALTHWSLPAMVRLNPGELPAIFGPEAAATETLEMADPEMVDGIERVLAAIGGRKAARSWAGRATRLAVLAAAVIGLVYWLPGAVSAYTASLVPPEMRSEIGADLLAETERVAGAPCSTPGGERALAQLSAALFPDLDMRLKVLPTTLAETAHLPDGTILISHTLVEDFETPDVVAGFLLAEHLRASSHDPLARLLEASPFRASLALLSTGHLRKTDLERMAEGLVVRPGAAVRQDDLLDAMNARGIDAKPYALAQDISGQATATLVSGAVDAPLPVLDDTDWIALQSICSE